MVLEGKHHAAFFGFGQATLDAVDHPFESFLFGRTWQHRLDAPFLHQFVEILDGSPATGVDAHGRNPQLIANLDALLGLLNVEPTKKCIEICYELGIPSMRINTGRWGTIEDFDELMKKRGIEPVLPGSTEEEGFKWVIDGIQRCLPKAEECGVMLA